MAGALPNMSMPCTDLITVYTLTLSQGLSQRSEEDTLFEPPLSDLGVPIPDSAQNSAQDHAKDREIAVSSMR